MRTARPPSRPTTCAPWRYLQKFAFASALTFGAQTQVFPWLDFEPPVSDFTGSSRGVGVFDRETDPDGIVRDARLFYVSVVQEPDPLPPLPGKFPPSPLADGAPVALPNLALVAGQRVFDLDKDYVVIRADQTVHLAGNLNPPVDIPVDEQGRMQIRYAGPSGHDLAYSFQDVATGKVKPEVFRDKVVLLGATAAGDPASDLRPTPFGAMPRVEMTANALQTLMDRTYFELVTTHKRHTLGVMILIGLAVGLTLMLLSRRAGAAGRPAAGRRRLGPLLRVPGRRPRHAAAAAGPADHPGDAGGRAGPVAGAVPRRLPSPSRRLTFPRPRMSCIDGNHWRRKIGYNPRSAQHACS